MYWSVEKNNKVRIQTDGDSEDFLENHNDRIHCRIGLNSKKEKREINMV